MSRSRIIFVLLLMYQTFFLNVLLPGHTRGAITVDGKIAFTSCCCCCGGAQGKESNGDRRSVPSQKDKENCAICQFAARVVPPTVVSFEHPDLGLLETLSPPLVVIAASNNFLPTYQSRGPPARLSDCM